MNYPKLLGRRVAIVAPEELAWEAQLEEASAYPDRHPSVVQTLSFHGHSRAGNVSGPLIYANYGSREDFKRLKDQGVDVTGAIVLVRYSGSQGDRGLKVKAAELAGAVGCLIYSDPNEDGFTKGKAWPEGPWRPSDSVQRGSVSLMSWVVGDVLTPGYASTSDAKRVSTDDTAGLVKIPSLPLAWRDARKLLQSLKRHGEKVAEEWIGGVPDVEEWWSGNQDSPTVQMINDQVEDERHPIWNVMGKINGIEQNAKQVVVGNHRDAWCFGASDPGSGTAVMLEVIQIFSELVQLGWRPLRTIQFASWDGEQYNLVGSTEWVEDHMDELRRDAIAYLNVGSAVSGKKFRASASPLFQRALLRAIDRTADPSTNETLRSIWDRSESRLKGVGAGSDCVAFQDLAGTSSIDLSFGGETDDDSSVPHHSCYDSFDWMTRFGDPDFTYHSVLAQIWALLILEVADRPVLPFDFEAYAEAVGAYIRDLEEDIEKMTAESRSSSSSDDDAGKKGMNSSSLDLNPLKEAAQQFVQDAKQFASWEDSWRYRIQVEEGIESNILAIRRMSHNSRMANFETHLLDLEDGGGVSLFSSWDFFPFLAIFLVLRLSFAPPFHTLFSFPGLCFSSALVYLFVPLHLYLLPLLPPH